MAITKKIKKEIKQITETKKFYTYYVPEDGFSVSEAVANIEFDQPKEYQKHTINLDAKSYLEDSNLKSDEYYEVEVIINVTGPKKIIKSKTKKNNKVEW